MEIPKKVTLIQQDPSTLIIWNVSSLDSSQLIKLFHTSDKARWEVDCDLDTFIQYVKLPKNSSSPKCEVLKSETEILNWIETTLEKTTDLDSTDNNFLIPTIAQDKQGKILMQAWANKTAVVSALNSGHGTYFSRSRNKLWIKGEESGHFQNNLEWEILHTNPNCLIYHTDQIGAACHTGEYTCFFREFKRWDDPSLIKL